MAISTGAALIGASVIGGVASSRAQSRAAKSAANAQMAAADQSAQVQREMFEATQATLSPFVEAGYGGVEELAAYAEPGLFALEQQAAIAGLMGPEAQAAQIAQIESDPLYQATVRQGEEALLQQASATGGLRGGNIQGALAQFRPQMLSDQIAQQYSRLGGFAGLGAEAQSQLASLGQASAAQQAAAGTAAAGGISSALTQAGQAQAGGALAAGQARAGLYGIPSQAFGMYVGGKQAGVF
jgi:hypothetical protein